MKRGCFLKKKYLNRVEGALMCSKTSTSSVDDNSVRVFTAFKKNIIMGITELIKVFSDLSGKSYH